MKCIKCGREIPEGELFCVECSLTPPAPEPSRSVAKPTKPAKPAKAPVKAPPPKRAAKEPAKRSEPARPTPVENVAAKPSSRRSKKATVAIVVLSLLLAASLSYIVWNFASIAQERRRLRAKEADLELQKGEMDALEKERDQLNRQLDEAFVAQTELEAQIEDLQDQLSRVQSSASQSQYDMTSQQQELERAAAENQELQNSVSTLEGQVTELTTQVNQLTASNATYSAKASFMDSYVVFVNNDGSKLYHKYDCPHFARQSFWAYSRKLAESNGYTACPDCN